MREPLPSEVGEVLLLAARRRLAEALEQARGDKPDEGVRRRFPVLDDPGASFVTLRIDGDLRGCVGSLEAVRALIEDVRKNVVQAAFYDPRFPALRASELEPTTISVTVLSPPEPFPVESEEEARRRLRPGLDGVVFQWQSHRSTLLPQVWEALPDPGSFLACLKEKAGLAADFWDAEVRLQRYAAQTFDEVGARSTSS